LRNASQYRIDGLCAATDLPHRVEVQFKVAGAAGAQIVTLLPKHNLVDQPPGHPTALRDPNLVQTCQLPLQTLEQGHEVPHRKDVMTKEDLEVAQITQCLVDAMREQARTEGPQLVLNVR